MNMNETKPVVLFEGMGSLHHTVSTQNVEAQKFFDQGLTMIYAFNHDEAIRSFQRAAELDPSLAMAYWGIAYALGPNYNLDADSSQRRMAYDALQKAIELSSNASERERDYINSISRRYSSDISTDQKVLNAEFRKSMRELSKKYPEDLDAATLYAESMMVLKPWQLWKKDGTPAEGTEEIVSVLESVLKRDPNHVGANHYYIHSVEASLDPGRALNSAKVLKTLVPAAGHLVHMPAHIFFRVGDYEDASLANIQAISADEKYIKETNAQGVYPLMYYNHNLNFLTVSALMEGKLAQSLDAAKQVEKNVAPMAKDMPMVEGFMVSPLWVLVAFHEWDEIIKYQVPDKSFHLAGVFSHFARGMAFASKGDIESSENELTRLKKEMKLVSVEAIVGLNSATTVINISKYLLEGKIKMVEGENETAIEYYKKAAEEQDKLGYDEPPDWYPSARLSLGGALFSTGNYSESERVFRDDLKAYPHNGWALFGLANTLKMESKNDESSKVMDEFNVAWKNADTKLRIEEY
jgi:tetratricopeptide (TPR) repeat protein